MTRVEDVLRSREWRPAPVGGGHDEFSVPARWSEPNCSAAAVNFERPNKTCTRRQRDSLLDPRVMATRPPELSMDAKWEAAIDLTLRRLVYGSLAGGAAGLMLFRE